MSKKEKLTQAIREFQSSQQQPDDYLKLIQASSMSVRQGDGLMWSDVRAAACDALYGEGNWGHFSDPIDGPHWSDKSTCDKSNHPG